MSSYQFASAFYNTIARRNSAWCNSFCNNIFTKFRAGVFVTSIFAGAFAFGVGFDVAVQSFWDHWNKGVSYNKLTCRTH